MSRSALFLLDERRPLTRAGRVAWVVGLAAYGALAAYVATRPPEVLEPVLWVPVTHAVVSAVVCGFTAILMVGQAVTSGRRGYLWLAGTYLYVAGVLFMFPVFFPGALRGNGPLIGGPQSSVTLFYAWHLGFLVGLGLSTWIVGRDLSQHRRPDRRVTVWRLLVAVFAALVLTFLVAVMGEPITPRLIGDSGELTALSTVLDQTLLVLAIGVAVLAATLARGGAQIQRWLLSVAILLLGDALVNVTSTSRWSFAWYFNRGFGIVALTALFAALLWIVARAGRATNQLAVQDALTGGDSRASFTRSMDEELAAARTDRRPVALLWIDLDGFKSINDELGHAAGDEVLRQTVRRIQSQVRATDHVGRLGGDEFGVLLCDSAGGEEITAITDRILTSLREPMVLEDTTTLLTSSIGVATAPEHGDESEGLLSRADLAMYAAKHAGGDRAQWFSSDLGQAALTRAQLRHQLAQAIRDDEFSLDFQPIVVPTTGQVAGFETLVRWERGNQRIAASEFIAFAERSGQIIPIGRQVVQLLEAAAPQLLALLPEGGFVTVNLSIKEMADADIVHRLTSGPLSRCAAFVIAEVTESQELFAYVEAEGNIDRLRDCGYRLALDDFGAGFSTFARLEQLRPHLLKVDRSFVVRAASGVEGGLAFLQAAVGVAQSLRCRVVAEGVETEQEQRVVAGLDIPFAQGFRYGRPQPLEAILTAAPRGPAATA